MSDNDYIRLKINCSFLLSAGIVGFIRFLKSEFADADEGIDYVMKPQELWVSKDYLENTDVPEMYVNAAVEFLGEETKFSGIMAQKSELDKFFELGEGPSAKEDVKKVNEIFKNFSDCIARNSFKAGFAIIGDMHPEKAFDDDLFSSFKKARDLKEKYELYLRLHEYLSAPDVMTVLKFKEIMYSHLRLFFENTSFFLPKNLTKRFDQCYDDDFFTPLLNSLNSTKRKTKRCIECMELADNVRSISFMVDTTDDIARKKSAYWNCRPDAYVCPVCSFIYTFVPFAFVFSGRDSLFLNCNSSLEMLFKINETYRNKSSIETDGRRSLKARLYSYISSSDLMAAAHKATSNVQVIFRSSEQDANHYRLNFIDKEMIEALKACDKELGYIEGKFVKDGENFIRVYNEVFDNILYRRSLYPLIFRLMRISFSQDSSMAFVGYVLKIETTIRTKKENGNMDDMKKKLDWAFNCGIRMRARLTEGISEKDADNSLRSLVYKLLNAVSTGDRISFLDSLIRVYSGKSEPIPSILKDTYKSDDDFRDIGTNYILGLKYSPKTEKNNQEA